MTKTEILKDEGLDVIDGLSKTATAVTAGLIHFFDTDGWGPAGAAEVGPHATPVKTVAAGTGQEQVQMIIGGTVKLQKETGTAIAQGQYVESSANAKCLPWLTAGTVMSEVVGLCVKDAASADTEVEVKLKN